MILIQVKDKYTDQKCDENCYNAEHPECKCVCGGRNHGVGYQRALEYTRQQEAYLKMTYGEKVMFNLMQGEL